MSEKAVKIKSIKHIRNDKVYDVKSTSTHLYVMPNGMIAHNCLDEISELTKFTTQGNKKSKTIAPSRALEVYQNTSRRIDSRFMNLGKVPFPLFMISSAKEEQAFLEQYVDTVRDDKHVLVIDDPIYKVKPNKIYSGKVFYVAVGDKYHDSRIIDEEKEDVETLKEQGYKIHEVPIEYKRSFLVDVDGAIRDILGICTTTSRSNKLIPNREIIERGVRQVTGEKVKNPFRMETLFFNLDSTESIADYLDRNALFWEDGMIENSNLPRTIHIDTGLTGDALGMAMGYTPGKKKVTQISMEGLEYITEDDIVIIDFILRIKADKSSGIGEIPLWKVREFISYLREKGVKIHKVTTDGFQSRDMRQLLLKAGYDCEITSVDKTDEPYLQVKNGLLEERLKYPDHSKLQTELFELEHDRIRGKVDHPETGSKDVADAVAGVTYIVIKELTMLDTKNTVSEYVNTIKQNKQEQVKQDNWFMSDYPDVQKIEKDYTRDARKEFKKKQQERDNNFGLGKILV